MRDRKPTSDRTRDGKRAPHGVKSKRATLARRKARATKRAQQGRA